MYAKLTDADPAFASGIHPNDRQRIVRGLEVFLETGVPISSYYKERRGYETEDTLYIGLDAEREKLVERINQRVDAMLNSGFLDEVKNLRKMGYGPDLKSMKSIGYAELNCYLDGLMNYSDAVDKIKIETRRYAKRQMTWFRRNKRINWFKADEQDRISEFIDSRLN